MTSRAARLVVGLGILALSLGRVNFARAQAGTATPSGTTLSGMVIAGTGSAIPNAKVSIKNAAGEQTAETQTDSSGHYSLPGLAPGDYELSTSADGYNANTTKVTIAAGAAGASQTSDITLNAPLSLGDLGFSTS
jgi:Carboxypeptidase regulatory-like domain